MLIVCSVLFAVIVAVRCSLSVACCCLLLCVWFVVFDIVSSVLFVVCRVLLFAAPAR